MWTKEERQQRIAIIDDKIEELLSVRILVKYGVEGKSEKGDYLEMTESQFNISPTNDYLLDKYPDYIHNLISRKESEVK